MPSTTIYSRELSSSNSVTSSTRRRLLLLVALIATSLAFSANTLLVWIRLANGSADSSYLAGVLPISLALMYWGRGQSFSHIRIGSLAALATVAILTIGVVVFRFVAPYLPSEWQLVVPAFLLVSLWIAGFWACFGSIATRRLVVPLLFLYFLVPIPTAVSTRIVSFLEHGSTDVAEILFNVAGVPNFRTGDSFLLVDLKIVVAQQCSGIRSSMALLMIGLVLSHLCLRSFWGKTIFLAAIPALAIFKNGLRIFALSVLSAYVSPRFLEGQLHRNGGSLFFALTILVASLFLILVQKLERISVRQRHVTH